MADSILIDHEQRLTRQEDRFEFVMNGVLERLKAVEAAAGKLDALNEKLVNMARRIDALEAVAAQPVPAATIGLDPNGA